MDPSLTSQLNKQQILHNQISYEEGEYLVHRITFRIKTTKVYNVPSQCLAYNKQLVNIRVIMMVVSMILKKKINGRDCPKMTGNTVFSTLQLQQVIE